MERKLKAGENYEKEEIRMSDMQEEKKRGNGNRFFYPFDCDFEKEAIIARKIHGGFRFNGWIYYPNFEMGGLLYKMRLDGTCETKITDFTVQPSRFYVRNGKLYFYAYDGNEHSIDL